MGQPHHGRGEPELYKDKVEVSLDGRQIFYLFFGGAVLVGLVFVLGVMVGRRVESRSHVDGLSRNDPARGASDPLAALDGLETKKLTFQDALIKGDPKTPVEHQIEELARAKADKPRGAEGNPSIEKPVGAEGDPSKKVPEPSKPEPVEKKPEKVEKKDDKKDKKKADKPTEPVTKPDQLSVKTDKPEKSDKIDKPEPKPEPKPEKKKPVVAAADDRVNADVITAIDKPVEAPTKGKFTLQLSSFQDKHEAETFLSSIKAQGYQAYVTEAEVSGKGTFYRVRMGKYPSLEAANDAKLDVEKAIKKSASVMRL